MVWAYFLFSQFLIIWSGNLAEETTFFLNRIHGGWKVVTIAVVLFHFILPFLLLLSRDLKRNAKTLAPIAAWLFVMRWLDFYWQAAPSFSGGHAAPEAAAEAAARHHAAASALHGAALHVSWLDPLAPIAIGGIWMWFFIRAARQADAPADPGPVHPGGPEP